MSLSQRTKILEQEEKQIRDIMIKLAIGEHQVRNISDRGKRKNITRINNRESAVT